MHISKSLPVNKVLLLLTGLAFLIHACAPAPTPVPFRAPTSQATAPPLIAPLFTLPPQPTAAAPTSTSDSAGLLTSPTPPCASSLRYIQDVNFPDDTIVQPRQRIIKTWLVENNGSCNWDASYRLRFTGGLPLGATAERALYPARAGTQSSLQISFLAPDAPGTYRSEWHAYDPSGAIFGDTLYIQISVP